MPVPHYATLPPHLIDMTCFQIAGCFMGRIGSGGPGSLNLVSRFFRRMVSRFRQRSNRCIDGASRPAGMGHPSPLSKRSVSICDCRRLGNTSTPRCALTLAPPRTGPGYPNLPERLASNQRASLRRPLDVYGRRAPAWRRPRLTKCCRMLARVWPYSDGPLREAEWASAWRLRSLFLSVFERRGSDGIAFHQSPQHGIVHPLHGQ